MTAMNYNNVRFNLTEAIHHLELLREDMALKKRPERYISEVDYWISSLDLLRNCLYDCKSTYDGQLDIHSSIKEIKNEITNFIVVVKDFKYKELKELDVIWSLLVKIDKILRSIK